MKRYIVALLIFGTCFGASSQVKVWSLAECIAYGVSHNTGVKKQQAQNEIQAQNYREAIGGLLPTAKLTADATSSYGRVLDKDTYQYVNTNTFYNEYQLYSSVTLFDGFAQLAKVRMERMNKQKGQQQLRLNKDLLAFEIAELYYNVQYNREAFKLSEAQLHESEHNLAGVSKMGEVGLKSNQDIAEMETQVAQYRFLMSKQENGLIQTMLKLKDKMCMAVEDSIVPASADSVALVSRVEEQPIEIYRKALDYNPSVQSWARSVNASEQAVRAAKGRFFPSLSLFGGCNSYFTRLMDGNSYTAFSTQLSNNQNYFVGLSLSVPVFSGFAHQTELKRTKQQLALARYDYDDSKRTLFNDIAQTVADVNGAVQEYHFAHKQHESAALAHKANVRKYSLGMISALEMNTSANRLYQSATDELNASFKYRIKKIMLDYYNGISLIQ